MSCHELNLRAGTITFGGLSGEKEQRPDWDTMSTTEALKIQLDNLQRELQLLQVENKKLRMEVPMDGESGRMRKEIDELTQRLFESEEKAITVEQEAEECKTRMEQLQVELEEAKLAGDLTVKSLTDQLASSNNMVEQLTKESSEQQLELDKLRVENKLLSELHAQVTSSRLVEAVNGSASEASLRSTKKTGSSLCTPPLLESGRVTQDGLGNRDITGVHSSHGSVTYLQQTGRPSTYHSELNVAAPTFIHSTYSAAPVSMMSKEADGHRLVQPRPPPLIPIQSSVLPVYSTSALPTGSSPSVLGGLSTPVHNLPFNFTSGGHTQPSIDTLHQWKEETVKPQV